jgi:hypothetical protein
VHLFGFIMRIYHDAWSSEYQNASSIIYRIKQFRYRKKINWVIYGGKVYFVVNTLTLKAYVEYIDTSAPSMHRSQHIHCCILSL